MPDLNLEKLETRIAFQDQELQDLNDVIVRQQNQLDMLAEQVRLLELKIRDMNGSQLIPESEETPPPHY